MLRRGGGKVVNDDQYGLGKYLGEYHGAGRNDGGNFFLGWLITGR